MGCTSSPSSQSASRTGALHARRPGQMLLFRKSPRQERARRRHRGGGGLAVPGPFKRIARAGGQKVTIQTAQRRFFANSSDGAKHFFATAETNLLQVKEQEIQVNQRCSGQVCGPGWTEVVSQAQRQSVRIALFPAGRLRPDSALGC